MAICGAPPSTLNGMVSLRALANTGLFRRLAAGKYQGRILTQSPCRYRLAGTAQAAGHSGFFEAGHQPKQAPGTVENWVGQGHSPAPLVRRGHRNVRARDFEDGVAGHERSGMAIGAKTEVNEVEHWRRPSHARQATHILSGRGVPGRALAPVCSAVSPVPAAHLRLERAPVAERQDTELLIEPCCHRELPLLCGTARSDCSSRCRGLAWRRSCLPVPPKCAARAPCRVRRPTGRTRRCPRLRSV